MKHYAGLDPDLHTSAFAVIDETCTLVHLDITKLNNNFKAERAVVNQNSLIFDLLATAGKTLPVSENGSFTVAIACWAVESQSVTYTGRSGKNPQDMIPVAQVAGAWCCVLAGWADTPVKRQLFPKPQAWKGSVPKQIHQARICKEMGWEYQKRGSRTNGGYCLPVLPPDSKWHAFTEAHGVTGWKHAMDAIGLALFAKEMDETLTAKGH